MHQIKQLAIWSLVVGLTLGYGIWASSFADYMYLEDLGLEDSPAGVALRKASPAEQIYLGGSLSLVVIGLISWVIFGILWFRRRPARFDKSVEI